MNTINKLLLEEYLNVNSPVSILNMEFNECNQNQIVHTHNFYEFFVVTGGRILHKHNDHIYEMGPGSAFFIAANDCHVLNKSKDCIKASIINVAFSEGYLKEIISFLNIFDWEDLKTGYFINSMKIESFVYIINKLSYIQQNHLLTYDKKRGIFRNLLSNFIIELFTALKENNNEIPLWLFSCCESMKSKENYTSGLQQFINLSSRTQEHLTRQMKLYYKMTPTEFINNIRLTEASKLLLNTSRSVLDIAYDVGFENVSYFIRIFKQKYGLTPREYRKQRSIIVSS